MKEEKSRKQASESDKSKNNFARTRSGESDKKLTKMAFALLKHCDKQTSTCLISVNRV